MFQFNNCISLGWYCGVAATLGRLGLRSFSGPFDWYNSDFEPVISLIDSEFDDFFSKENLVEAPEWKKTFRDEKYGFVCFHDIHRNLEEDYQEIHDKYRRRAEKFLEALHSPTCLFRTVRSEKEIEYIVNHREYIDTVIKRFNNENRIIYLFEQKLERAQFPCDHYNLNRDCSYDPYQIRTLFDHNEELLKMCGNLLPTIQMEGNKKYYYSLNNACAGEVYRMIMNKDSSIAEKIVKEFNISDEEGIYLWGYGKHGKALFKYLQESHVKVVGVVDEDLDKQYAENSIIISSSNIPAGSNVFISIENDAANREIIRALESKGCTYLTYRDLYHFE